MATGFQGTGMVINGVPMGIQNNAASTVPAAPVTQQLASAPGSFTGTSPSSNIPSSLWNTTVANKPTIYDPGSNSWISNPFYNPSLGSGAPIVIRNGQPQQAAPTSTAPASTGTAPSTPGAGGTIGSGAGNLGSMGSAAPASSAYPTSYGGSPATQVATAAGVPTPSSASLSPTGAGSAQYNNPFYLSAQNSAVNAGNVSGNQATTNVNQANNLQSGANTLQGAAGAVLNTAFDPQQALYNQTLQKVQDQSNVAEAQRGLTMSPYGAGISDTNTNNFNIAWQAQQLANQVSGLGAAGTATNAANTANTGAANLGNMAVGQTQAVGQLPATTADAQQNQDIQSWIAYMNQANAATGLAQTNYPLAVSQQSMTNAGGVPYIPQSSNTFSLT